MQTWNDLFTIILSRAGHIIKNNTGFFLLQAAECLVFTGNRKSFLGIISKKKLMDKEL